MSQDLEVQRVIDPDDLGVAAGYEQAQEREVGTAVVPALDLYEMRKDMSLQMIDFDDGLVRGKGQSLGERGSDQERAEQARAARKGDGIHRVHVDAGHPQSFGNHWQDVLLVGAGSQFRNDAAIAPVNLLRSHHVGQQICVAKDGRRGVVTRRFDA